jgi:hypothetical protein
MRPKNLLKFQVLSQKEVFYRDRNLVPAIDLGTLPFVGYGEEER